MKGLILLLSLISASVWAHSEGHGAIIDGIGTFKGHKVGLVAAKDAPLGPQAPTLAEVEWVRHQDTITFYVWGSDKKEPVSLHPTAKAKLIQIYKDGKVKVVELGITAGKHNAVSLSFNKGEVDQFKTLEVVLPEKTLTEITDKSVFAILF